MARISAYKFVSPIAGGGVKSPTVAAASQNLVALNNVGFSLTGIAGTVKDLHRISLLTIKNDKLYEQALRRKKKREDDLRAEEELENRKLLTGKAGSYDLQQKKGLKKLKGDSKLKNTIESILGPFKGLVVSLLAFVGKILALAITREILVFASDPRNQEQLRTFMEKTVFVFGKLYDFSKWLIKDKFLDGFSALTGENNTFRERLKGLGDLLIGITTLGALLNPFGLIDGILRLLGMDFYRPGPDMVNSGSGNAPGSKPGTQPRGKPIRQKGVTPKNRIFKRVKYDTRAGSSFNLERTRKINMMNNLAPKGFMWDAAKGKYVPKPPGLTNVPGQTPTGNVFKYKNISKTTNRTLLKLIGKKNTLLVKGAFQQLGARIPWMGGVFTAIYSLMAGEPIKQTMFKTVGSLIGGTIGTFLPIPWLGSILGLYAGEYIGDLFYMGFSGATAKEIGDKVVADVKAAFDAAIAGGTVALNWAKRGFGRFYEGIPKWRIPEFPAWAKWADFLKIGGKEIPNPLFLNPTNALAFSGKLIQAFFTNKKMDPGDMKIFNIPKFGSKKDNNDEDKTINTRSNQKQNEDKKKREEMLNAITRKYNKKLMPGGEGIYGSPFYKEGDIVYEPNWLGYNKKYYTIKNGQRVLFGTSNMLTRDNFKSDEVWEAFKAGGGNAKLLEGGITPEQIIKRGFKAIETGSLNSWEKTKTNQNNESSGSGENVDQVSDTSNMVGGLNIDNNDVLEGRNEEFTYQDGYEDGFRDGVTSTQDGVAATNNQPVKIEGIPYSASDMMSGVPRGGDTTIDPRDISPDHSILEAGYQNPFSPGFSTHSSGSSVYKKPNSSSNGSMTSSIDPTILEGIMDIEAGRPRSEETPKKKAWWDPFGVFTGKSIGGLIPSRLKGSNKSFFLGKVFRGIGRAVSGVFNGVKKAVTSITQSPIFGIASTILSFTPLAPIVAGVNAVSGILSGNPLQAITGAFNLGSTFFPQTFSNITNGINNTFGKVLGGGINGFLTGGIQGGLGGLMGGIQGMLPQGVQNFFGKIGGFIEKFPSVGGLINMIPGVANIPGLAGMFGLDSFGAATFSPMNMFQDLANNFGLGGLFRGITGMMQGEGGFMDGLMEMAAELGVNPQVLGVMNNLGTSRMSAASMTDASREYAMQTSLEFIPLPVIIEKLTPIPRPIPINNPVPVPQPQKQQKQEQKK